jgi:hypothetical protein
LISKKVSIGVSGSGTNFLAKQILHDNGVDKTNATLLELNSKVSKEKLLNNEIDALFIVSSSKTNIVKDLLSNPNISALSFKRSYAYDSKYSYLASLVLYEGTIDLYRNLPYDNINLLTTTANLISSDALPDELVRLVLIQAKKIHSKKDIFEKEFQFPNLNNLDSKIHEEATKYLTYGSSWLEKIFPFWIASNIDRLKILIIPLLTIMIPLLKGVIPLYVFTMRSKIYKWYKHLDKISLKINKKATNNNISKSDISNAIEELVSLKKEIEAHTKVPLSYRGEYYNLLLHVDFIMDSIKKR